MSHKTWSPASREYYIFCQFLPGSNEQQKSKWPNLRGCLGGWLVGCDKASSFIYSFSSQVLLDSMASIEWPLSTLWLNKRFPWTFSVFICRSSWSSTGTWAQQLILCLWLGDQQLILETDKTQALFWGFLSIHENSWNVRVLDPQALKSSVVFTSSWLCPKLFLIHSSNFLAGLCIQLQHHFTSFSFQCQSAISILFQSFLHSVASFPDRSFLAEPFPSSFSVFYFPPLTSC